MKLADKKDFLINFSFTVIICTLIFFIAKFTLMYLTPFVLAVIIAALMQKPSAFLEKKIRIPKGICAAILAAGFYVLIAAVVFFLFYRIFAFSGKAAETIPSLISYISGVLSKIEGIIYRNLAGLSDAAIGEISSVLREALNSIALKATNWVSMAAATLVKSAPSFLFSSIVALVASCYIAKDYDGLKRFLKGLCNERIYENTVKIKLILSQSVFHLLKGYIILTVITFIQLLVGFWVLKINHAILLAIIVSFIDLLPVLGTGTVLIPWSVFLLAAGNGFKGIGIILLYFITVIIRNFLEPKIIGKQMGINPLFMLISMFAGLKIIGFWGLLIFPIVLIVVIRYYKNEMEEERKADKM